MIDDVTSAARGDRDAFGRLVAQTGGMVCAIALAIVRDVPTSEDLAQEVFLAAWAGMRRLRNPHGFLPWIRQLTRYRARSFRRDRKLGDDVALAALADSKPAADEQLVVAEQSRALAAALAALPDETREVVILYYREGQSTAHLSALLGVSEAAVRQRLSRARVELRADVLERLGGTLEKTSPSAAFSATVMATVAAPSTATAAGIAKSVLAKGLLGGAGLGALLGIAGIFLGLRRYVCDADQPTRTRLARFAAQATATTLVACAAFVTAGYFQSAALAIGAHLAFGVAMAVLYWQRLPRIVGRQMSPVRRLQGRLVFVAAYLVSGSALIMALIRRGWL